MNNLNHSRIIQHLRLDGLYTSDNTSTKTIEEIERELEEELKKLEKEVSEEGKTTVQGGTLTTTSSSSNETENN